jgi:uncharacterized protein
MKQLMATCAALGSLWLAPVAWAAPASEESIKTLMVLTRTESVVDQMWVVMEQSMRQTMQQSSAGQQLTAEQQQRTAAAPAKMMAVLREELSWVKLEPGYIALYKDTFEQSEVDGMIAFYRSPAGQSFVAKMPLLMQRSMVITQAQMKDVLPKMQAAMQQAVSDAKAAEPAK